MNALNKYFLLLIFFIPFLAASAQNKECTSILNISTGDSSAAIFLNDSFIGSGRASREVEKGRYKIFIKDEARKWGAQEIHDSISVTDCGLTKNLEYSFKKTAFLRTNPDNADVYYRDSLLGSTPLSILRTLPQVEVRKTNYKPVFLSSDELVHSPVIDLEFLGKKPQESFFKTNMFKILLGTAVALGTTAAYYKMKANKSFDQYNQSGDNTLLDRTNRYDLYSGIAFGALQVNFGALIYFFLVDE
ncbi:MAG: hypothetical protein HF312_16145 [Ignavibacteria bacterium]|jgi:hypothetical protein|nr:hypothetical protein [Ignavibacteria bacterium]MCU7521746.1 hypothetical protein [Ignavibacteria bacterium]